MTAQSNITPESIVGDLRYLQLLGGYLKST